MMKKILLTITISFMSLMAFTQLNIYVSDSIGYHDCDSSQVFLYNSTPQTTFPVYYRWEINGNTFDVGSNQNVFETWIANTGNIAILYAFSDSIYQTAIQTYTHFIATDSCGISDLFLTSFQDSVIDCSSGLFTITAYETGGTGPFTYQWSVYDNNTLISTQTTFNNQFTEILNDGAIVELFISDAAGNNYTNSITVATNSNLLVAANSSVIASDCATTTLQFDATTNMQTTLYSWEIEYDGVLQTFSAPTIQINIPNTVQIVYATVTVFDLTNNNCTATDFLFTPIVNTNNFNVTSNITNNSTTPCIQGQCDFEITLTPSGGTAPYLYALDSGMLDSFNVFTNLCPGAYTATVEDATGCATSLSVFVSDVLGVQVYENSYFSSCDSGTAGNGSYMNAYASGATTVWSDGFVGSYYFNPTPGIYTYLVTDSNSGCTASGTITVPTNNCYTISGNVYADLNGDCIFNNNDYAINSVWVDLANSTGGWVGIYDFTDAAGNYSISAPAGTYYFDVNGYNVNNFTQNCPSTGFSVTIGPNNPNPIVDFYMTPPPPVQDLSISLHSFTTFTPGFPYWAYLSYCNVGTIPMSGTVVMNYDAGLTYVAGSSVGAINDAVNHTLTWTFTNLNPSNCATLHPDFVCSTSAVLGTTMSNTAIINPIVGDVTPNNNTAYVIDTVVGSWDPNDKAVYPQAGMLVSEKDHDYTIRFQNKGTAPATFVIVRDDLDDNLDLQTLRNVSASHNFVLTVENTDELVFTFNNIMLPAEQDDTTGSNGSIHFTISQKDDLPLGTVIENTAAIYFDFNEPVITNTTINTIVEKTTGIKEVNKSANVSVFPNPNHGVFSINAATKIKTIKVYNLIGKAIFEAERINNVKALVNLQKAVPGVYLIKTETANGISVERITIYNQ